MQRIIVSVTNDLLNDQRVKKVCDTLQNSDFEIILIGRILPNSLAVKRAYRTIRMRLLFSKGFLFYAEYNIRLFIKLFFLKKDILLANDLDTLLPNYLISKIFSKKLVYDSHEVFTEVPELISRPKIRAFWLGIEKFIFPKLKNIITVNKDIADLYSKKYQVDIEIIRNLSPKLKNKKIDKELLEKTKGDNKMLILQGTGINIDRGAEEAIAMMQYLENIILHIIGSGDVFEKLKASIKKYNLEDKVFLLNKMPYSELIEYTKISDLGLSLDKGTNLNYELSLPNKIFDYIQSEIPVLCSNRKLVANLVSKNNIGYISETHDPRKLAKIVTELFDNKAQYQTLKESLKKAAAIYTWEHESEKLIEIYSNLK